MKASIFTNEYPPHVYGGAGVHVDYLTRELSKLISVEVRCFGDQDIINGNLHIRGFDVDRHLFETCPKELESALAACYRCVAFNAMSIDSQIVHCHTWYTHFAGILAKLKYDIPLVITIHSLEPLRPWKKEQLGRAYNYSSWVEKTAIEMADMVIAVSEETRRDVLNHFHVDEARVKVIYNGIDVDEYCRTCSRNIFEKYGIDRNKPYLLFVGRITRQKGIIHLVNAIPFLDPSIQVVLCAGAPDTKEIAEEMKTSVARVRETHKNVFWIQEMVDKRTLMELYSHAAAFCCPSIYEPFGIINLEAMACETPVVASAVGGIKEVVIPGETGILVPLQEEEGCACGETNINGKFSRDLAKAVNDLIRNPQLCEEMGKKGRKRAEEIFSWHAIAEKTVELYRSLIDQ
ncbi:MAG: glycogen synthase [bacterium]